MVKFDSYSKGNNYFFPPHNVSPETKKGKDWCKQFAQAIYSLYLNDQCTVGYSSVAKIARLRSYGDGCQDKTQYMDRILGGKTPTTTGEGVASRLGPGAVTTFARKGYANINFDILKIAPKFKTVVVGTFMDAEYDVFADGVDEKSSVQKQQEKAKLWVEMQYKNEIAQMEQIIGAETPKPDYIPETVAELEMYDQMGGFRLKSEIAIESAIQYTLFLSRWKDIKNKLITDLFEIGIAGVKDEVNPQTQKVQARYCNPAMSVVPYSQSTDFENMPFAGEFVFMTIAELRQLDKFTEEELHTIACSYQNFFDNAVFLNGASNVSSFYTDENNNYLYNQFKIAVLDCEFKSDDYSYTVERVNEKGEKIIQKAKFGKVKNDSKRKTTETKTLMVYKCKWVVGSDLCWDYGHQFDIPRPTPSQAKLSFHFTKIEGPSMTEMMIGPLDQIQLTYLKMQAALAAARPAGLAIDISTLNNVAYGGKTLGPLELLKISNQTGNVLYSATTHKGYQPQATGYKPIQELQGGVGQSLNEFILYMERQIMMIQDITGINRVAAAGNPASGDLVGISEMSMQATITALKPLINRYVAIKEKMCENAVLRIQLLVKVNGRYKGGYYTALGQSTTQILDIGSEINNAMYNIRIQARPSAEEKARILTAAQTSLQAGKNGLVGISTSDYLILSRFVDNGMLKLAEVYLAFQERKAAENQDRIAKENIQLQQQGNAELKQIEAQSAQALLAMQRENYQIEMKLKTDSQIAIDNNAHQNRMQELMLTEGTKREVANSTNQTKKEVTGMNVQASAINKGMDMAIESEYIDIEREKIEAMEEMAEKEAETETETEKED